MINRLFLLLIPLSALAAEPDRGANFGEPCASIAAREKSNGVDNFLAEPHHDSSVGGEQIVFMTYDGHSQHSSLYACDGKKWSLSHIASFDSLSEATKYISESISYFNSKYGKPLTRDNHLLSFWNKAYLQLTGQSQSLQIHLWDMAPNDIELALSSVPRHGWEVSVYMAQTPPRDKALLYPED